MNKFTLKYNIDDRVFVKSLGREGIIESWHVKFGYQDGPDQVTYGVTYEQTIQGFLWRERSNTTSEYFEKRMITVKVDESDICLAKIKIDFTEAVRDNPPSFLKALINSKKAGNSCEHVWKTYEGFTNKYDYCEKCDEKKT
jgi:hypothetical protein